VKKCNESDIRIENRKQMGFKARTKNGEGWSRGDMRWKTVPQTGGWKMEASV